MPLENSPARTHRFSAAAAAEIDAKALNFPRNAWRRLEGALACLEEGHPAATLARLAEITHRGEIGTGLITVVADQAIAEIDSDPGHLHRIRVPADYLKGASERHVPPPLRRFTSNRKVVSGFPAELIVPPITGNGNDFGFLLDAALCGQVAPTDDFLLHVVAWVSDATELWRLRTMLRRQTWPADRLRLSVFAEDGSGAVSYTHLTLPTSDLV